MTRKPAAAKETRQRKKEKARFQQAGLWFIYEVKLVVPTAATSVAAASTTMESAATATVESPS